MNKVRPSLSAPWICPRLPTLQRGSQEAAQAVGNTVTTDLLFPPSVTTARSPVGIASPLPTGDTHRGAHRPPSELQPKGKAAVPPSPDTTTRSPARTGDPPAYSEASPAQSGLHDSRQCAGKDRMSPVPVVTTTSPPRATGPRNTDAPEPGSPSSLTSRSGWQGPPSDEQLAAKPSNRRPTCW